jgi:hypothetical protein
MSLLLRLYLVNENNKTNAKVVNLKLLDMTITVGCKKNWKRKFSYSWDDEQIYRVIKKDCLSWQYN